jgi:eukaryotic-like serine/threonine-protein kinase
MSVIFRTVLWTTAAVVICFGLAWGIHHDWRQRNESDVNPKKADRQTLANPAENWPQFHGDQTQRGSVSGYLSEKLSLAWRFETGDEVKSSPAIVAGRVYVGSSDKHIYALDLQTGKQVWSAILDGAVEASPTLVDNVLYIGTLSGTLYALDARSGSTRWVFKTDYKLVGGANWFRDSENRLRILIGSYDAFLYCIDAQTGKSVWTYQTGSYINGSPAVDNRYCAFGGCDAVIHVLSIADGSKAGEIKTGAYIAGSTAVLGSHVYAGNYNGDLFKASLPTGNIVWSYSTGGAPFVSSPAVTDEVVVIGGGDMRVHCVDNLTGKARWTYATLGAVDSSPVIAGDMVVAGSDDGRLYLLSLTDGKLIWSFEIGRSITSSPAVADGMVVVGCDDGMVYCFK